MSKEEAEAFSRAASFIQEALRHAANAFTVISSPHFIPFFNEAAPSDNRARPCDTPRMAEDLEHFAFPAIEQIPFPKCIDLYLQHLDQRHASVTVDDIPELVGTGRIAGWNVPDHFWREYLIYGMVEQLNDVVDAINIIIADVEQLPELRKTLRGFPSKRVDLAERSFHGEVYRGREIIRRGLGEMRRRGFIGRELVQAVAEAMHEHLGDGFKLRNLLAHGEGNLTDRHFTAVRSTERSTDDVFVVLEDGTEVTIGLFVKRLCDHVSSRMRNRSKIYFAIYRAVIQLIAGEASEQAVQPS